MEVGTLPPEWVPMSNEQLYKPRWLMFCSIGGDRSLESVTTLPSEFGTFDFKSIKNARGGNNITFCSKKYKYN